MIETRPETDSDTLVVQATAILSAADYERDFMPLVDRMLESREKINLVLYLDDLFEGWDLEAMWDEARFGMKHRHHFERAAVVGAQAWFKWAMQLGSKLMDGEFKTFEGDQLEAAITWAKEGQVSARTNE